MNNPNRPYPGRQLFLGLTVDGKPCLAYLVTGRSPQSRERKAILVENGVRMGPIGGQQYDPLRHYTGVKCDNNIGLVVVSNGIQTEAIFETYKLLYHTGSLPGKGYMEKILDGARSEPDSLHTPRIAGIITNHSGKVKPAYIIGIKIHKLPAKTFQIEPEPATMTGISTYNGDLDNPESFDVSSNLPKIVFKGRTAEELAEYLYNISSASYKGDDIRVCSIGGVRSDDNRTWHLAIRNRHES